MSSSIDSADEHILTSNYCSRSKATKKMDSKTRLRARKHKSPSPRAIQSDLESDCGSDFVPSSRKLRSRLSMDSYHDSDDELVKVSSHKRQSKRIKKVYSEQRLKAKRRHNRPPEESESDSDDYHSDFKPSPRKLQSRTDKNERSRPKKKRRGFYKDDSNSSDQIPDENEHKQHKKKARGFYGSDGNFSDEIAGILSDMESEKNNLKINKRNRSTENSSAIKQDQLDFSCRDLDNSGNEETLSKKVNEISSLIKKLNEKKDEESDEDSDMSLPPFPMKKRPAKNNIDCDTLLRSIENNGIMSGIESSALKLKPCIVRVSKIINNEAADHQSLPSGNEAVLGITNGKADALKNNSLGELEKDSSCQNNLGESISVNKFKPSYDYIDHSSDSNTSVITLPSESSSRCKKAKNFSGNDLSSFQNLEGFIKEEILSGSESSKSTLILDENNGTVNDYSNVPDHVSNSSETVKGLAGDQMLPINLQAQNQNIDHNCNSNNFSGTFNQFENDENVNDYGNVPDHTSKSPETVTGLVEDQMLPVSLQAQQNIDHNSNSTSYSDTINQFENDENVNDYSYVPDHISKSPETVKGLVEDQVLPVNPQAQSQNIDPICKSTSYSDTINQFDEFGLNLFERETVELQTKYNLKPCSIKLEKLPLDFQRYQKKTECSKMKPSSEGDVEYSGAENESHNSMNVKTDSDFFFCKPKSVKNKHFLNDPAVSKTWPSSSSDEDTFLTNNDEEIFSFKSRWGCKYIVEVNDGENLNMRVTIKPSDSIEKVKLPSTCRFGCVDFKYKCIHRKWASQKPLAVEPTPHQSTVPDSTDSEASDFVHRGRKSEDHSSPKPTQKRSKVSPTKDYICFLCKRKFYNRSKLCHHACDGKKRHGYVCQFCEKYFTSLKIFQKHKETHLVS